MIKVAMVVDSEQGHFFHTLQLAQELSKRGHQVTYWSFPEAERLVRAQVSSPSSRLTVQRSPTEDEDYFVRSYEVNF